MAINKSKLSGQWLVANEVERPALFGGWGVEMPGRAAGKTNLTDGCKTAGGWGVGGLG